MDAQAQATLWSTPVKDADVGGDESFYDSSERRVPLWPPLLLTALILLYLETLVGLRRSFLQKLGRGLRLRGKA